MTLYIGFFARYDAVGWNSENNGPLMLSFIKDVNDFRTLATKPQELWEGYEDYCVFLNTLYNEGLISPDFATDTSDEALNQAVFRNPGPRIRTRSGPAETVFHIRRMEEGQWTK